MKGLLSWLRIKLIDLTTSDMYWYVNTCRSRCLHQSKLFAVDWTVSNLSWTSPNAQLLFFENWQPDSSIIRRLNIRVLDELLHKVAQRQHTISSSFPKYMYVPHQQDSYGPDITKNHSKIHFIFTTTRKVHHRKSKTSIWKNTPDLLELLAKPNPGYYDVKSPLDSVGIS